jgi:hypothetical protein
MKVIEEIGTDSSLEILQKAAEEQGKIFAREFKEERNQELSPLEIGEKIYFKFMNEAGADVKIYQKKDDSISFIIDRCPFFEAFLDVGINCGIFLEGLCSNLTLPTIQTALNSSGIKLKVEAVLCKESIEDYCLEKISLRDADAG